MKYLLITTRDNLNPGDQFIRIGVENLVREVDPTAEFERLSKEDPQDYSRERPFDRAILCGMPLWWNNHVSKCQDIYWWAPILRGWPSAKKENFLVLGAGSAVGDNMVNPREMFDAVEEVIQRSFAVTTRQPVFDRPDLISSICPAAFASARSAVRAFRSLSPSFKLFNAMPDGAHDSHFNPEEAAVWQAKQRAVSDAALEAGFVFIAHSADEKEVAKEAGWPESRIMFFDTPEAYLEAYARCSHYIGNRLHGAMMAACSAATSVAIGYDSRVEMLKPFTPNIYLPSEFQPGWIETYRFGISPISAIMSRERKRLHALLQKFIHRGS